jgi:hypothetical protein
MKVLIVEKLSENRYKTPEGYLICKDAILARTGKQTYKHNEVYIDSDDDSSEVEVNRTPEQVFSDAAIASFENKALTIQHPDEAVTANNHKNLAVGFVRDVKKKIVEGQEVLVGNIVVTDADAITQINDGLSYLSCGYDCDITQGESPQQTNIRGNHVALCSNPRAGITKIIDSTNKITTVAQDDSNHFIKVLSDALDASMSKQNAIFEINKIINSPDVHEDSEGCRYLSKRMIEQIKEISKEAGLTQNDLKNISSYFFGPGMYSIVDSIEDATILNDMKVDDINSSKIWNPDFYLKKEPGFKEAENTIKKVLQNSSLTPEEITLSVYGCIIRFNKNIKLDGAQIKTLLNEVLAKINPALKAEKLRSMAGKVTFDIVGYEYLKKYLPK